MISTQKQWIISQRIIWIIRLFLKTINCERYAIKFVNYIFNGEYAPNIHLRLRKKR